MIYKPLYGTHALQPAMDAIAESLQYQEFIKKMYGGGPGSGCRGGNCGRPRGVKQTWKSPAGFTYSVLKPSRKNIARGQSSVKRKDEFKGQYKPYKIPGAQKDMTLVKHFDGKGVSDVHEAQHGRGDRYEGQGKTVFVHRDFGGMRVTVQEVPHDEMNHTATMKTFKFKNFGQAADFLNKKYGIRWKLPKVS